MERAELAEVVRSRIAQVVGVPVDEIGEGTDLRDEYEMDSLELMEIGTRLENTLGTRISADDLLEMRNVGHCIDLLHRRVQERV
ncbi:acyl carrier protein [Micromonospora echinofusca]|uniref:Acyl carrier protein n=1 Tax=Micromonospora echinofusca TaxID=47858 RepID=A0ABS3VQA5_MICEH|nr:acyl carrier protein [Micromonospora echinofusca]MBO4206717.1 acyl carrier protein [Micromonospora echinofusca]